VENMPFLFMGLKHSFQNACVLLVRKYAFWILLLGFSLINWASHIGLGAIAPLARLLHQELGELAFCVDDHLLIQNGKNHLYV
jgi:hypothetical protein